MFKKVLIGFVAIFVIIGVIGAMSGGNEKQTEVATNSTEAIPAKEGKLKVSAEFMAALATAEMYSNTMHMSKKALYEQLVSQYAEKFPKDAAQYAIDNIEADWNNNALETAKRYQETMNMSRKGIYDQLTSPHGEKFTKEQADYALENLPK